MSKTKFQIILSSKTAPISRLIAEDLLIEHISNFSKLEYAIPYTINRTAAEGLAVFILQSESDEKILRSVIEKTKNEFLLDTPDAHFDLVSYDDARYIAKQNNTTDAYGLELDDVEFQYELELITPQFVQKVAQDIFNNL